MFGYIIVNKPELKIKDYESYRSFYCGLCRKLKQNYGLSGQMTLSYDMTFLILLFSGLYEPPLLKTSGRCMTHPFEKHTMTTTEVTAYAADMNLLLSYLKCQDDWRDERKMSAKTMSQCLKRGYRKIQSFYPHKVDKIEHLMKEIGQAEQRRESNIDQISGLFGHVMEEIFAYKEDLWEEDLRRMGFYLGKFIYILDAYDDLEKDAKEENYNPFLLQDKRMDIEEESNRLLTIMMAECAKAFERLPIVEHADILRNILYGGVWGRYEYRHKRRNMQQGKEQII